METQTISTYDSMSSGGIDGLKVIDTSFINFMKVINHIVVKWVQP